MTSSQGSGRSPVHEAVAIVRAGVDAACRRAGRSPDEVRIVAATKTVSIDAIAEVVRAGIRDLAENRAVDLAMKVPKIDAVWHYVGPLQSGTAARVADHADVIHSAVPGRAIERVGRRARGAGRPIRCLIQVDDGPRQHGVPSSDVESAVRSLGGIEGITVVGLMTLPPWTGHPESARPFFVRLRELRDRLRDLFPEVTELSMGMSADYEVAVEEGATMVRVGTALFGARPPMRRPGGKDRGSPPAEG